MTNQYLCPGENAAQATPSKEELLSAFEVFDQHGNGKLWLAVCSVLLAGPHHASL